MLHKISHTVLAFALVVTAASAAQLLTGVTDKDSYRTGEEIVFTFTVHGDESATPRKIKWERKGDDGVTENGSAEAAPGGSFTVKTASQRPGFVYVNTQINDEAASAHANKRELRWNASAAVEPEALEGIDEPADFDAFWTKQKARLAATPWKDGMKREKVESDNDKFDIYRLTIPAPGPRPATAHMVIPKNAGPDAKKALKIEFHGYGWAGSGIPNLSWLSGNEIVINVNAHGFELGREPEYYKEFEKEANAGGMYGFVAEQNKNPETTYFNGMILRDLRVLEYAKTLPEWNGKNLTVSGGSQGGFQALLMAALDRDVTHCDASAPWMCDLGGKAQLGRWGGWQPAFTDALNYYDTVHHARRIPRTCQVVISRNGLGDHTCPPSGITVVYNNITAPKKMRCVQGSEHGDWGAMPAGTQIINYSAE